MTCCVLIGDQNSGLNQELMACENGRQGFFFMLHRQITLLQSDFDATQTHGCFCPSHSLLKTLEQLELGTYQSYGAEIVANSVVLCGVEGVGGRGNNLSGTVSVSERLILTHMMEYLCMWMQCCHFLSDRSYQATRRRCDVMCSVYSIFQMKALWTSPYINMHYHVLTPSLSSLPPH